MGSKSHSLDVKTLLLLSLHHDLFSVVDIHAGLRRLAAYLEALEGVPVGVVVGGSVQTRYQFPTEMHISHFSRSAQ